MARTFVRVGFTLSAFATPALALTIDFSSPTYFDRANSTGLWNTVAGQAQTGVAIALSASKRLDFGDGSDGAFSDGPAQSGISVSGNTITFDTNTKATFQFTSFTLSAGKTLVASGSSPLVILVLGNATVAGTVQANGSTGTTNQLTAGYPPGGAGGAGGGSGGQGGSVADANASTTATAGTPATSPNRDSGKAAANSSTATLRAGGGGCHSIGASAATAGTNNAGSAGSCGAATVANVADTFDTTFLGGAGGGGGGARVTSSVASGSGGGGGGGGVRIAALGTLTLSGAVQAKGGAGGSNEAGDGTYCGGSGGGGSGGAVWAQTLGTFAGAGTIDISGGTGGTSALCGGTTPGGNGSSGVYRADSPAGTQPWGLTPGAAETRTAAILAAQSYTVTSKAIDLSRNYVTLGSATETFRTTGTYCGSAGTTTVVYEGSRDGVTWSGSVSASQLASLSDYPYIRFKVTFDTTGGTPPCLSSLVIPVSYKDLTDLSLRGGLFFCARMADRGTWSEKDRISATINGALFALLVTSGFVIARRRPNGSRSRTSDAPAGHHPY